MLRNVFIKKILKSTVFSILSSVNQVVPKDNNKILLYTANGGIQHALVPIRSYLLCNGFQKNNIIYCGVKNMRYKEDDGCIYINQLKAIFVFLRCGHVFYTAGQIPIKPSKKQKVLHLGHGSANFKTYGLLSNINNGNEFYFTHRVLTSPLFIKYDMAAFGCKEENEVVLGDVMLDMFKFPVRKHIESNGNKVLMWLPTFRQSDYLGYSDSDYNNLIPLFSNDEYERLNKFLREKNVKVIVKLHDMQSVRPNIKVEMSNLVLLTDKEMKKIGIDLYPFLNTVDGLIGDYSSVSMHYLYLDRPQAFVVPDIDEYKKHRGFLFDDPEEYMGGWIIKNQEQFFSFIEDFSNGIDRYADKRKKIRKLVHTFSDYNNSKRVIEFSGISNK